MTGADGPAENEKLSVYSEEVWYFSFFKAIRCPCLSLPSAHILRRSPQTRPVMVRTRSPLTLWALLFAFFLLMGARCARTKNQGSHSAAQSEQHPTVGLMRPVSRGDRGVTQIHPSQLPPNEPASASRYLPRLHSEAMTEEEERESSGEEMGSDWQEESPPHSSQERSLSASPASSEHFESEGTQDLSDNTPYSNDADEEANFSHESLRSLQRMSPSASSPEHSFQNGLQQHAGQHGGQEDDPASSSWSPAPLPTRSRPMRKAAQAALTRLKNPQPADHFEESDKSPETSSRKQVKDKKFRMPTSLQRKIKTASRRLALKPEEETDASNDERFAEDEAEEEEESEKISNKGKSRAPTSEKEFWLQCPPRAKGTTEWKIFEQHQKRYWQTVRSGEDPRSKRDFKLSKEEMENLDDGVEEKYRSLVRLFNNRLFSFRNRNESKEMKRAAAERYRERAKAETTDMPGNPTKHDVQSLRSALSRRLKYLLEKKSFVQGWDDNDEYWIQVFKSQPGKGGKSDVLFERYHEFKEAVEKTRKRERTDGAGAGPSRPPGTIRTTKAQAMSTHKHLSVHVPREMQ